MTIISRQLRFVRVQREARYFQMATVSHWSKGSIFHVFWGGKLFKTWQQRRRLVILHLQPVRWEKYEALKMKASFTNSYWPIVSRMTSLRMNHKWPIYFYAFSINIPSPDKSHHRNSFCCDQRKSFGTSHSGFLTAVLSGGSQAKNQIVTLHQIELVSSSSLAEDPSLMASVFWRFSPYWNL